MAEQVKVKKKAKTKKSKESEEQPVESAKTGVATVDVIDDWLSEIDDILEENEAAEFVKNFVQKGGE